MIDTFLYKQLTAFILLAAFLAQTFSKMVIIADYYTDTASYAKNCINKSIPLMHCNGKCQMTKKLQQEENKDQENPERKQENKNEFLLSSRSFFAQVPPPVTEQALTEQVAFYSDNCPTKRSSDIFHPPQHL